MTRACGATALRATPRRDHAAPRRAARAAPGLTFIEVIVAAAMLVGLTSAIMGAISFLDSSAARQRHRLQGMEVAHRLVAQYLDDKELLPDSSVPIQQGESFYRFSIREEILEQDENAGDNLKKRRGRLKSELTVDEQFRHLLQRITVTVYVDDPSNPALDASRPIATLSRMFSPFEFRDQDLVLKELMQMIRDRDTGSSSSRPSSGSGK